MSGGVSQDMGTGVLASKSISFAEMVSTTRYAFNTLCSNKTWMCNSNYWYFFTIQKQDGLCLSEPLCFK